MHIENSLIFPVCFEGTDTLAWRKRPRRRPGDIMSYRKRQDLHDRNRYRAYIYMYVYIIPIHIYVYIYGDQNNISSVVAREAQALYKSDVEDESETEVSCKSCFDAN